MHRTIIVGRGLIGSAAARHLSAMQAGVLLVGPGEPADRASHAGVFGSHYDEGRITRVTDAEPAWAVTAARSIARYAELEAGSGIRFYTPSGYLAIGEANGDLLARMEAQARPLGAELARLDAAGVAAHFPFLALPPDAMALHERSPGGHVNPRAMVRAQVALAQQQGAEMLEQVVRAVRPTAGGVEVETADGTVHRAERALIATGAYTDAGDLVGRRFDLRVFGRTIVFARIDAGLADALAGMPTMTHAPTGAYILPPIRYPDGHTYVKIGIGSDQDVRLASLAQLSAWFKSPGSEANRRDFIAFLTELMPPLAACGHWHTDSCAVTQTATGLPYIDLVHEDRIAVAIGGNGKGAKSADDWGFLAATLVAGQPWAHPVPREACRLPPG